MVFINKIKKSRTDLLFQGAAPQVSSAQAYLTTEFEMGSGVTTLLLARDKK